MNNPFPWSCSEYRLAARTHDPVYIHVVLAHATVLSIAVVWRFLVRNYHGEPPANFVTATAHCKLSPLAD